MNHLFILFLL